MAVYRDKRRTLRPWLLDISYVDRRTGERKRYFRNAKLQTAEGRARRSACSSSRSRVRTIVWNAVELGKHHGTPDFPKLNKVQSKVFEPPLPEQVAALVAAFGKYVVVM